MKTTYIAEIKKDNMKGKVTFRAVSGWEKEAVKRVFYDYDILNIEEKKHDYRTGMGITELKMECEDEL